MKSGLGTNGYIYPPLSKRCQNGKVKSGPHLVEFRQGAGGEKMQLDPSKNAMQKNAKKIAKNAKKNAKKCNFQRNSLINP